MKKRKRLGIWMDDLDAHLMDFKTDIIELNTIESTFVHPEKFEEEDKRKRQVKQKREHNKFHKDLSETIKYYDEVIIFGSTLPEDFCKVLIVRHLDVYPFCEYVNTFSPKLDKNFSGIL